MTLELAASDEKGEGASGDVHWIDLQEVNAPCFAITLKSGALEPRRGYAPLYNMTRMSDGPLKTPFCDLNVAYVLRHVTNRATRSPITLIAVTAALTMEPLAFCPSSTQNMPHTAVSPPQR